MVVQGWAKPKVGTILVCILDNAMKRAVQLLHIEIVLVQFSCCTFRLVLVLCVCSFLSLLPLAMSYESEWVSWLLNSTSKTKRLPTRWLDCQHGEVHLNSLGAWTCGIHNYWCMFGWTSWRATKTMIELSWLVQENLNGVGPVTVLAAWASLVLQKLRNKQDWIVWKIWSWETHKYWAQSWPKQAKNLLLSKGMKFNGCIKWKMSNLTTGWRSAVRDGMSWESELKLNFSG